MNKKKNLCVCIYKMVLKITKETWGKCGITTVKCYNKKQEIIELWKKKGIMLKKKQDI